MRPLAFSRLISRSRHAAIAWCVVVLLLFATTGALALEQSMRSPRPPVHRPARGGGPQTGTGTSDVVRVIVPPKSQG